MSNGIIYIATNKPLYVELAALSATSVKRLMPDISITLYTDQPCTAACFDNIVQVTSTGHGLRDKIVYMGQSPYEYTLFLDSDTCVVRPFPEIFALLDRFDVAAAHDPTRAMQWAQTIPSDDVPVSYPELNTGVFLFKKSPPVEALFQDWVHLFDDPAVTSRYKNDQPYFRIAAYHSDVRIATLTQEYDYQFRFTGSIDREAKILYGHVMGKPDHFQKVDHAINAETGLCTYLGGKVYAAKMGGRLSARRSAHLVARYPEPPINIWYLRAKRLTEIIQQRFKRVSSQ